MTTKSKCCGASFSGIGDWTSSGTPTVDYFCGACGKRCELEVPTDTTQPVTLVIQPTIASHVPQEEAEQMAKDWDAAVDANPLTDEQWCKAEAERLLYNRGVHPSTENQFIYHLLLLIGLAEGRRREREQIQKEVLPEWAEKRLAEREEAAAREAWEEIFFRTEPFIIKRDLSFFAEPAKQFEDWWKQRGQK